MGKASGPERGSVFQGSRLRSDLIVVLGIYAAIVILTWEGFGPRDAEQYIFASSSIAAGEGLVGDDHWALRWPLVLPIAVSFAVFGTSAFAACLPNMIYGALLVSVSLFFGRRAFGRSAGLLLGGLVAISPFFTMLGNELRVFGPEILFVVTSLWLLIEGKSEATTRNRRELLVLSGLFAGLAWLCRESTVFLGPFVAAGALVLPPRRLTDAVWVVLGGSLVFLSEIVFYSVATGDPLYRLTVSLDHGGGDPSTEILTGPAEKGGAETFFFKPWVELFGTVAYSPFVYLGIAAALFLGIRYPTVPHARPMLIFAGAGLSSFLVCAYALSLETVEYYPLVLYAALLPTAVVLATLAGELRRGARMAGGVLAGLAVLSLAAHDLRNDHEYREARLLARFAADQNELVYAGGVTAARAQLLLVLEELDEGWIDRSREKIPEGSLVWVGPDYRGRYQVEPLPGWQELGRVDVAGYSLPRAVLRAVVPEALQQGRLGEVLADRPPVIVYRTR